MADQSEYAIMVDAKMLKTIQENLNEMPPYVKDYFRSRLTTTSVRTLRQYSYSLRKFFRWLKSAIPELENYSTNEIPLDVIAQLTPRDVEEYMVYLQADSNSPNSRGSVAQKISCLSAFLSYLYRHGDIPNDPCVKVDRPKVVQDKRIIYLTDEESIRLLDTIEYGNPSIPAHQLNYLEKTRCRDLAIATLLLNTGIRLSECVGLDITDIDLNERKMQVYRKGGKYQYLPLNDEVLEILTQYIAERKQTVVLDKKHANALFLSMQRRRINGMSIENMITKYAQFAGITKPITPHKLRKTYGTALYRKTRDIYMTANALGHENVATTSRHYVDDNADSLREVADTMRIRPTGT